MTRKRIPDETEKEVLVRSGRRCAICFGLKGSLDEVQGQIAHLDRDHSNNKLENLAYLCLPCHDKYDTRTSQSKGFTIKEVKHYRDMLYKRIEEMRRGRNGEDKDNATKITTFVQLAQAIWELLSKNGRAFTSFGPNSGAESAAPVRWDLQLWEEAKKEIILPNNRKIQALIERHFNLVPNEYRAIFTEMSTHIYAFEKHCENPTLDYREHQFPEEFAQVIDQVCVQAQETQDRLVEIEGWLLENLLGNDLPVDEGYIIGSVLRGFFAGADVDVFLLLGDRTSEEIKASIKKLTVIKRRFLLTFGMQLHVIVFSHPERDDFYSFLEHLQQKRAFIH